MYSPKSTVDFNSCCSHWKLNPPQPKLKKTKTRRPSEVLNESVSPSEVAQEIVLNSNKRKRTQRKQILIKTVASDKIADSTYFQTEPTHMKSDATSTVNQNMMNFDDDNENYASKLARTYNSPSIRSCSGETMFKELLSSFNTSSPNQNEVIIQELSPQLYQRIEQTIPGNHYNPYLSSHNALANSFHKNPPAQGVDITFPLSRISSLDRLQFSVSSATEVGHNMSNILPSVSEKAFTHDSHFTSPLDKTPLWWSDLETPSNSECSSPDCPSSPVSSSDYSKMNMGLKRSLFDEHGLLNEEFLDFDALMKNYSFTSDIQEDESPCLSPCNSEPSSPCSKVSSDDINFGEYFMEFQIQDGVHYF